VAVVAVVTMLPVPVVLVAVGRLAFRLFSRLRERRILVVVAAVGLAIREVRLLALRVVRVL
jgi:hypothetical protein